MPKVFISYRREDSQHQADRIRAALTRHLPKRDVFIDIDSMGPGVDFVSFVDHQIAQCDVLLALIGPGWIADAERLANPKDFVRMEIATALGRNIKVIPVLLDGAEMPGEEILPEPVKPLVRRNAVEIRRSSFDDDTQKLLKHLGLGQAPGISRQAVLVAVGAGAAALAVAAWFAFNSGGPSLPQIAGRWEGWASSGFRQINYTWFIDQQGSKVTGTIKLSDTGADAANFGSYEFEGAFNGEELTFGGTRIVVGSQDFCMARGVLTLSSPGTLDGAWGDYPEMPGGCVTGLQGSVHLERK